MRYTVIAVAGLAGSACTFEHGERSARDGGVDTVVVDGGVDAPIDAIDASTALLPESCKAIHTAQPVMPSGTYMIDPDGDGGDAPLSVACDMTTDGGGWTVVFFPPTPNTSGASIPYTSSTPRLLADAQSVLLAYRSSLLVAAPHFATFPLPAEWRADSPFHYAANDVPTTVRVDGAAAIPATLRFGYSNFASRCSDPWNTTSRFGRICIAGTNGPFFDGFQDASADFCNDGNGAWNSTACATDRRFSIAVR